MVDAIKIVVKLYTFIHRCKRQYRNNLKVFKIMLFFALKILEKNPYFQVNLIIFSSLYCFLYIYLSLDSASVTVYWWFFTLLFTVHPNNGKICISPYTPTMYLNFVWGKKHTHPNPTLYPVKHL